MDEEVAVEQKRSCLLLLFTSCRLLHSFFVQSHLSSSVFYSHTLQLMRMERTSTFITLRPTDKFPSLDIRSPKWWHFILLRCLPPPPSPPAMLPWSQLSSRKSSWRWTKRMKTTTSQVIIMTSTRRQQNDLHNTSDRVKTMWVLFHLNFHLPFIHIQ